MQQDKGRLYPEKHIKVELIAGNSLDAVAERDVAVDTITLLQPREPSSR